ncbi:MAG: hypothetical protein ACM3RP_00710 [Chitinophagales bacterium]
MKRIVFERETLYDEVWREPMTIVAKRYEMSDVALHKICKKLNIPVPGRGYWAKLRAGGKVKKAPLPKSKGPQTYISERPDDVERPSGGAREDRFAFLDPATRQRLEEVCSGIVVPEQLTRPHPLVSELAKHLRGTRRRNSFNRYQSPPRVLDVSVTESSRDRALKIMDTLIKSLEKLGHAVEVDQRSGDTYVRTGQQQLPILLKERTKQVDHVLTPAELKAQEKGQYIYITRFNYLPTDELTLTIDGWEAPRKNWSDGKQHHLEDHLGKFIMGLVLAAEIERKREEERREEERRRTEAERRRLERQRLREEELSRFAELQKAAEDWQLAETLRRYVEAVGEKLAQARDPGNAYSG